MKLKDYPIEIYIYGEFQSGLPELKKKGQFITLYYPHINAKLTLEYMDNLEYERIDCGLTKKEQEVYHYIDDDGLTFEEVSKLLNISLKKVENYYDKAGAKLVYKKQSPKDLN